MDPWNIPDMVALIGFLAGLSCRFIDLPHAMEASRIIFAIDLMVFYLRILHTFSIHRKLGPKLVMIGQMVCNLS